MKTPYAKYVDALVVHAIGDDSKSVLNNVRKTRRLIKQELPLFQNEYEYLQGPASRDRCHNTVQNIMNWFQLAHSPTWYWIHALKPTANSEASGYSLGFWKPINAQTAKATSLPNEGAVTGLRTSKRFKFSHVSDTLEGTFAVCTERGDPFRPASGFRFRIDNKSEVFLLVHDRGHPTIPKEWERTDHVARWDNFSDRVYRQVFEPGIVTIPPHDGRQDDGYFGVPHAALVRDISGNSTVVQISDLPPTCKVSEVKPVGDNQVELSQLKPGHWDLEQIQLAFGRWVSTPHALGQHCRTSRRGATR